MAATIAVLGSALTTTAGNKTVTATPTVGDLIVVIAVATGVTTTIADNGTGGTYTQVGTTRTGFSTSGNLQIFIRDNLITSSVSTTYTATQTSSTGGGLVVLRVTGMAVAGAAAVRSSGGQSSGTTGTTPAPVLSATPLSTNPIIAAIGNASNSTTTLVQRTGYTEGFDNGYNTPPTGLEVNYLASGETTATLTQGGTSGSAFASQAIELAFNTAPTVALNTPSNAGTVSTVTPTFNFTATDANSDSVEYNIQVASDTAFSTTTNDADVYFTLDEPTGSGALPSIGSVIGTWGGTLGSQWGTGKLNGAGVFNGTDNRIDLSTNPNTVTDNFSISAWIKPASLPQTGFIFYNGNDFAGWGMGIGDGAGGSGSKLVGLNGGLAWVDPGAGLTLTNAVWQHVALVRRSGTWYFYLNGVETSSGSSTSPAGVTAGKATIGDQLSSSNVATRFFNGSIDEVGVWSRALTAAEIVLLYNTGTGRQLPATLLDKVSSSDAGFTAGHPFASGSAKDFTVQAGNELTNVSTQYWRVRAIDPSGSNAYGAWTASRSVLVDATVTYNKTITGKAKMTTGINEYSLTSGSNSSGATSYATASITPTANRLILLAVASRRLSSATIPTVTGNGLTWVQVATAQEAGSSNRITVFRALGASPTTGAITIDFGGITQVSCVWSVSEFEKVVTTGTNGSGAITQSVTNTGATVTSLTATLAAFGSASNATYGAIVSEVAQSFTEGSGLYEIHDRNITDNALGTLWKDGNDTTVDWSFTPSSRVAAVAIEIAASTNVTTTKTVTGVARLQVSVSQTVTGKARLQKSVSQTVTGVARLQKSVSQTITGIARITKSVSQTITGLARVQASTTQTITGKADIRLTTTQTITGISRIQKSVNQTITGIARMQKSVSQTVTGLARLQKSVSQTITGKADIKNTTNQTITGKANIIVPPATPVLDNFNRANAATLGANWSLLKDYFGGVGDEGISSNQAYNPSSLFTNYAAMYWNPSTFGPDSEVYVSVPVRSSTNDTDCPGVYLRVTSPGASFNGYVFGLDYQHDTVHIDRIDGGVSTILDTKSVVFASGDKLWFRATGSTLEGYVYHGGSWNLLISVTDSIYNTAGYLGFYIPNNHSDDRLDDFGGGGTGTITTTQTITGKSRITKSVLQTITGISRITASTLQTITGKANIRATTAQTITGKARLQKSVSQTVQGLARITKSVSQTITGKGRIGLITPQTITGKARITASTSQTITGKARVTASTTQTILGKARLTTSVSQTITGKARLTISTLQTITGKARLQKVVNATIAGLARITASTTRTIAGKARITSSTTQTATGKARITASTLQTVSGKARITVSASQTITGKSRITKSVSQTITGKSRITTSVSQVITGLARLQKSVSQTITGKGRITISTSQTVTGKSRITVATPRTITGKANLLSALSATNQTITGLARVTASTARTVAGVARITISTVKTVAGKARITKSVSQVITGIARITKNTPQTITGKARVTVSSTQTVTGKSRITTSVNQTISGKARVSKNVNQTINGTARITSLVNVTLLGLARISTVVNQVIQGVARVQSSVSSTITGKARITKTGEATITGKAFIVVPHNQLTRKKNIFVTFTQEKLKAVFSYNGNRLNASCEVDRLVASCVVERINVSCTVDRLDVTVSQ